MSLQISAEVTTFIKSLDIIPELPAVIDTPHVIPRKLSQFPG